ncbi:MAG: NlpC/P60 family protein [Mycobacteriales bacterium]
MATSKRSSYLTRVAVPGLSAASIALMGVVGAQHAGAMPNGAAGIAAGRTTAPVTSEQAAAHVLVLGRQLEIVTEGYNTATITLGRRRAQAGAAQASVTRLDGQLRGQRAQVRTVARSAYEGGNLASLSAFMGSTSPADFLAKAGTLDVISREGSATVARLAATETRAITARTALRTSAAAAASTATKLLARQKVITTQVATMKQIESRLSKQEKAALAAATGSLRPPRPITIRPIEPTRPIQPTRAPTSTDAPAPPPMPTQPTLAPTPTSAPTTTAPRPAPTTTAAPTPTAPPTSAPSTPPPSTPPPSTPPTSTPPTSTPPPSTPPPSTQPTSTPPTSTPPTSSPPTSSPPPKPVPPPSSTAASIAVKTAIAQIGKPYLWAGAGPDAFDCSGLTMYSWQAAGVSLPHSSGAQYGVGTHVSEGQLQPGDLVFYYSPISHVAIYVGNGMVVHASTEGEPVKYALLNQAGPYAGATHIG